MAKKRPVGQENDPDFFERAASASFAVRLALGPFPDEHS